MNSPLVIEYYSDVLCVWAWIAQKRIDELHKTFAQEIEFKYHYIDIFGDVPSKIKTSWKDKGGYKGFSEHVNNSASDFEDAVVNQDVWRSVRPNTSANPHLYLKAIQIAYGELKAREMSLVFRQAFFIDAQDISKLDELDAIVRKQGLSVENIRTSINDGLAMAQLMGDYQQAKAQGIKGSPSYVIDGGRQTLYGNVGYRVLHANIEEMLKHPKHEASWC